MSRGRKPSEFLTKAQMKAISGRLRKEPTANYNALAAEMFPGRKVREPEPELAAVADDATDLESDVSDK